jgi:hypothetical protein
MTISHSVDSRAAAIAAARLSTLVLAAAWVAVSPAMAGVYKCAGADGGSIYQEDPCPPGKELRNFDTDPPNLSVIPGTSAPPPAPAKAIDRPAPSTGKTASRTTAGRDDRSNGKVDGDASGRKFIRTGMTDAEVRAKIGQPDMTSGSSRSHNARWSYLPAAGDPDTITTITFAGNTVSDVTRKLVKK